MWWNVWSYLGGTVWGRIRSYGLVGDVVMMEKVCVSLSTFEFRIR